MKQLDINNAFLHGDLKEYLYMVALLGLTSIPPVKVCKLKKALYDFKQANRVWFVKLSFFLLSMGYTQSMNDHSLFIHSSEGNDKEEIARIKQALN